MFAAGVDVVRLNFSHGTAEDHMKRAELVRETCRKVGRAVGIMADLQGPKIRVGKFKDGKVTLKPGERFILDAGCEIGRRRARRASTTRSCRATCAPGACCCWTTAGSCST